MAAAKLKKSGAGAMKVPTPMMRHFLEVKEEHPDCLVLYRCGDFYETFYDDARTAARELDITLTSRDKNSDSPVPMAGVPYHAANQYISRLVERGYKVAVCEQMEDPKTAKGMVKREVTRVVTPGLVVDEENLQADSNNFILSVWPSDERQGLAALDISTGEFTCTETNGEDELAHELVKLSPRELILPESARAEKDGPAWLPWGLRPLIDHRPDIEFDLKRARENLLHQFKADSLRGYGCENLDRAVRAAGALLSYVRETQKRQAEHVTAIRPYSVRDFMVMDEATKINLELERTILEGRKHGSLLGVLDCCRTPIGSRTLKRWLNYPLLDADRIRRRLNVVEALFLQGSQRETLSDILKEIGDLSRLATRIGMDRSNGRDLLQLAQSLDAVGRLKAFLADMREDVFGPFHRRVDPLPDLAKELERAVSEDAPVTVREGRMFKKGYHEELDELIDLALHGKDEILRIEAAEKQATGLPTLKVRYNRVFGYYIEISKAQAEKAPEHYIRKQTLTNAERFITPELKEYEDKVLHAEERRNDLEYRLFEDLRGRISERLPALLSTAETVGSLDALASLSETAARNDYVRPEILPEGPVDIRDGRHPVVEALQKDEPFIPNDTLLDTESNRLTVITGPNMAGKSTIMRQVALIVLMAQVGSFVPAGKASIGLADRIFTRVGAADNLVRGLSTFMVEMTETANILNNATKRSLIILDEIGRGTSTFDGLSIAWAVAEHIHDRIGARTLFATHYHELTELARTKPGLRNMSVAVKEWEERIIFLRKLVDGATNRSYGIQVGRLAGLPPEVIARAREVLDNLEHGESDRMGMPSFPRPRGRRRTDPGQLSLFSAGSKPDADDPVLVELDRVAPETLSPIEALTLIFDWKKRRKGE